MRRIITILSFLPALLLPEFALCKSTCQMSIQAPVAAQHSCCTRSNDPIWDSHNSVQGLSSEASPVERDCCRPGDPTRQGLQPQQASLIDPSLFSVPTQPTFFTPGGGASLRLALATLEAMGGLQVPETHAGLRITQLRI